MSSLGLVIRSKQLLEYPYIVILTNHNTVTLTIDVFTLQSSIVMCEQVVVTG